MASYVCQYCGHDGSNGYNVEVGATEGHVLHLKIVCRECKASCFNLDYNVASYKFEEDE